MGQGQQGQPHVPVEARADVLGGPEVGAEVAVAEHHALGAAGSAGGVDDGGQVIGLDLLFGGQGGGLGGYRLSLDYGKIVEADDHVEAVDGLLQDLVLEFAGDEEGFGLGMFEDVLDLAFGKIGQHRDADASEGGGGEVGYAPVGHVLGEQSHEGAAADAVAGQELRDFAGLGVKFPVGVARPVDEVQEGLVLIVCKGEFEQRPKRPLMYVVHDAVMLVQVVPGSEFFRIFSYHTFVLVPLSDAFEVSVHVVGDVELLLGAYCLGTPVEIAEEDRYSGSLGYQVETALPPLYGPARALGGDGQLEVFVLLELLYHLADQVRSAAGGAVHGDAAEMPQDGAQGPFEEALLDHHLGIAPD